MVSEFRKKKLLHVFNSFFDSDGSGSINKKDFDEAIESIPKLRGWKPSDPEYKEVQDLLREVWAGLKSSADANDDGQVTKEEWIAMWDNYAKNPSAAADWQTQYCKFIFKLEDSSNDGSIDAQEFSSVYASFGMDKTEAESAFQKMAKGKASVSWTEFQELWKEYFSSEDTNAPGNYIFGKTSF